MKNRKTTLYGTGIAAIVGIISFAFLIAAGELEQHSKKQYDFLQEYDIINKW